MLLRRANTHFLDQLLGIWYLHIMNCNGREPLFFLMLEVQAIWRNCFFYLLSLWFCWKRLITVPCPLVSGLCIYQNWVTWSSPLVFSNESLRKMTPFSLWHETMIVVMFVVRYQAHEDSQLEKIPTQRKEERRNKLFHLFLIWLYQSVVPYFD